MRWPWQSAAPTTAVIAGGSVMPQAQVQMDATERSNGSTLADISDSISNAPSSASTRQPPTAQELLERGLATLEKTPKEERGTSLLINDVGELLREQGRLEEARCDIGGEKPKHDPNGPPLRESHRFLALTFGPLHGDAGPSSPKPSKPGEPHSAKPRPPRSPRLTTSDCCSENSRSCPRRGRCCRRL